MNVIADVARDLTPQEIVNLVFLGLAAIAVYAGVCLWWPETSCRRSDCEGGKIRSPTRRNWRNCPRCKGKGRKTRLGAVILRALSGPSNKK